LIDSLEFPFITGSLSEVFKT